MKLKQMAKASVGMEDADFWIPASGPNIGKPTKTFDAKHIGVKVTRTDLLVPGYLYYAMEFLHMQGCWECRRPRITATDVLEVNMVPTP